LKDDLQKENPLKLPSAGFGYEQTFRSILIAATALTPDCHKALSLGEFRMELNAIAKIYQPEDLGPLTFGFDIGMASVGWAVLNETRIVVRGVRAFNKAETAKEGES
jgi:hypothetical protein